jgi:type IV pilus assembly protein PilB
MLFSNCPIRDYGDPDERLRPRVSLTNRCDYNKIHKNNIIGNTMAVRLGQLMVRKGLITEDNLRKALEDQKKNNARLGNCLIRLGFITEDTFVQFLSDQYRLNVIDLEQVQFQPDLIKLVPLGLAKKFLMIPVRREGSKLIVAMADPHNMVALDDIKFMTGYHIEPVIAPESAIIRAINNNYSQTKKAKSFERKDLLNVKDYSIDETDLQQSGFDEDEEEEEDKSLVDVDEFDRLVHGAVDNIEVVEEVEDEVITGDVEAPIVRLVNGILIRAVKLGVSDIHIEPYERTFRVRYRLDGVLNKAMGLPLKIRNAIISRVKIISQLDIAERRLPQDGRVKIKLGKRREMDFRVSVLPTLWGEKVVLRLLDKSNLQLDMTKLGFEEDQLNNFKDAIYKPYGMVLVTGPTGSGKTTTLYSALSELNKESENIMTAEDPVEFDISGINQVQVHDDIGLNFASALRSFLRQDPDIIMVGEIRDFETAEIGIKAALTGHMVLSTLHTNDAPSTINRLLNMGIEPFLVSSATNLILAQRLARRVCKDCLEEDRQVPEAALLRMGVPEEELGDFKTVVKGKGCDSCLSTGYKGRVALYEIMPITEEIKELILIGASTDEIKHKAVENGMTTLRQSGISKIKEGITTVEEVIRTTAAD